MKLSKTFFAGIPALALVFGMILAGCDNGSTDSGGGGGGGGNNSLTGSWVDNRAIPTRAFIFTDVADAAITGAKVAYWSTNLISENTAATGTEVTIGGTAYTYTLSDNTMTVTNYGINAAGNAENVTFNRAKGTSGSTMHGIWISNLPSTDANYTMLIIRTSSANILSSVGSANMGEAAYALSSDANASYIKWGNGNPMGYIKDSDPTSLTITAPNNQQIAGLITQPGW
jgi:hypothetical protein